MGCQAVWTADRCPERPVGATPASPAAASGVDTYLPDGPLSYRTTSWVLAATNPPCRTTGGSGGATQRRIPFRTARGARAARIRGTGIGWLFLALLLFLLLGVHRAQSEARDRR